MLEYHAAYYRYNDSDWVIARVLDFPGVVSQGKTLRSAQRMMRDVCKQLEFPMPRER